MRWRTGRRSANIEDRRGMRVSRGIPLRGGLKGGGIGTIVLVLVAMYFGIDPTMLLQGSQSVAPGPAATQSIPPQQQQLAGFISVVLADTEDTWHQLFKQQNKSYQEPKLVLFSNAVQSACGMGEAAMGPFYCPGDQKVYIDLSFYDDLKSRHGAPGDFAQAYVVAHEIGHHVQTLSGISTRVHAQKRQLNKVQANALSVRQELQADCYAGIWAHHAQRTRNILETGDIEEALNAATAIGDDRLQKQARGYVTPESFTHGSSKQRVHWFNVGFRHGEVARCDTFQADLGADA